MSPGSSESRLHGSSDRSRDWGVWCNELEHVYGSSNERPATQNQRYVTAPARAAPGFQQDRATAVALPLVLGVCALVAAVLVIVGDEIAWALPLAAALIVATVFAGVALWRDPSRPRSEPQWNRASARVGASKYRD